MKAQGVGHVTGSLSYEQLAELQQEADSGNSVAAIRLAGLPPAEQRLAASLVKVYGGKVKKPKKPKVTKGRKKAPATERDVLEAASEVLRLAGLESSNPAIREWARMAGHG